MGLHAQQIELFISGRVSDAGTGEPVASASVVLDSQVVSVTDGTGMYDIARLSVSGGTVTLKFQRLGFVTTERKIALPDTSSVLRIDVELLASAMPMDEILVEGERETFSNPDLAGFYERREQGHGTYLTADEIARTGVRDFSNHLRRLRVHYSRNCLVTYLDGTLLMDLETINEWVPTSSIAGMEFHRSTDLSHLPQDFFPPGTMWGSRGFGLCDVLMFWSKEPIQPSPFEVGMHFASGIGGDELRGQQAGVHLIVLVSGRERTPRLHMAASANIGGANHNWRALLNLTMRPLGHSSPFYAGSGLALAKSGELNAEDMSDPVSIHHTVIAGVGFEVAGFRPFVELHLFDPLKPSNVSVSSQMGLSFRIGGNSPSS